ncbi:uracil-DNA glycosylase [Snuella lapsa]|uniref:Uracil-DNA glycosylase n=1 Tax=Snuella lapsa TaxID=870481 RepID=A0ABP6Y6G3_9FLAO
MNVEIEESWKQHLELEFAKPYFQNLAQFVKQEYGAYTCYPPGKEIFNAFNHCRFEDVKVVLIGQDPYHGVRQANGLCFSVNDGIAHPPSLKNIFKEIDSDIGVPYPKSGNLMRWADQGVLLLNATLTVRAHQAGSHQNRGWETFTDAVIKLVSDKKENIVFLLWGGYAKKKMKLIDTNKHHILASGHPSPLSANKGHWFGNKHFSKTNSLLEQADLQPVLW